MRLFFEELRHIALILFWMKSVYLYWSLCLVPPITIYCLAWERYVAIVKWTEYKVLITKGRLKKYTVIAWMDSVTKVALYQALVFAEVPHEVLFVVDLAINLSWLTETLTLL